VKLEKIRNSLFVIRYSTCQKAKSVGLERQKHVSALNGAPATGCETPDLYGKKNYPEP
jgi:hypothetical protein